MGEHPNPNTPQKAEAARQERFRTFEGTKRLVETQEVPEGPDPAEKPKPARGIKAS